MANRVKKLKQELSFERMNLSPTMLKTLAKVGYVKPTPIQAGLIPLALQELDVMGQARTGTGKTAAFAIPVVEMLELGDGIPQTQALILTPTRELAVQVETEVRRLADGREIHCCCLYGGVPIKKQINQLKRGCHIAVGTPGRVLDHLNRGTLDIRNLWMVVLDEADRMLDIGFRPDIERILKRCPRERQTLLLSATIPEPIKMLGRRYMYQPRLINFSTENLAADTIDQFVLTVPEEMKFEILIRLLQREEPAQAIIFCRTRLGTERLYRKLLKSGEFEGMGTLHGDMSQSSRDRTMGSFRGNQLRYLVATDVVGRGIDITGVSHIINFDVPELSDDYVHRVGRTGRMGKQGVAFTMVTTSQRSELSRIEQRISDTLKPDPLQEYINEKNPMLGRSKKPKKKYRRAL